VLFLQGRNAAPAAFNAASMQARSFADAKAAPTEVSSILEQRIRGVQEEAGLAETGRVLSVGYVTTLRKSLRNGIQKAIQVALLESDRLLTRNSSQ
jgi:hypothetical protein